MKKLVTITAALLLTGPALGADLSVPPAAPAVVRSTAPTYFWTGCFLGGQAGYGFSQINSSDPSGVNFAPPGGTISTSPQGPVAGGQLGCDFQFHGHWVVGTAADYAWANIQNNIADPFLAGGTIANKTDGVGSITARLGYALDRLLIYGKGGLGVVHDVNAINLVPVGAANRYTGSDTSAGWTAGAGVEWAFVPNASARIEFNYYDIGTDSRMIGNAGGTIPLRTQEQFETLTVGINYRFGVVAVP